MVNIILGLAITAPNEKQFFYHPNTTKKRSGKMKIKCIVNQEGRTEGPLTLNNANIEFHIFFDVCN